MSSSCAFFPSRLSRARTCRLLLALAILWIGMAGPAAFASPQAAPPASQPSVLWGTPAEAAHSPASQELLPDLLITDLWTRGSSVCYQVYNQGPAAASPGHTTALWVDGRMAAMQEEEPELTPGQRHEACFQFAWWCSSRSDELAVAADYWNAIPESSEDNNLRVETVRCDLTPPVIVDGPVVIEITPHSAVVHWFTDEPSDSRVRYGHIAERYEQDVYREEMVTSHFLQLFELNPETTYAYTVSSADSSGNLVTSRSLTFTTPPLVSRLPRVSLPDLETISGTVVISASIANPARGDRVLFFLDGELLLTDYSFPYTLELDSRLLDNRMYEIEARAVNSVGDYTVDFILVAVYNQKDSTYPSVNITTPAQGQSVSGKVSVTAKITDDTGIISARFYVNGDYQQFEPFDVNNPPKSSTVTFVWDSRSFTNGSKIRLAVQAYDLQGKETIAAVDVVVNNVQPADPPSAAYLEVTNHSAMRDKNRILIFIQVKNSGATEASNVRILDGLVGFQAKNYAIGAAPVLSEYIPSGRYGYAEIRPKVSIPPGEYRLYAFHAMPVLHDGTPPKPSIGSFVDMYWDSGASTNLHHFQLMPVAKMVGTNESVPAAHAAALKASDYLLVTNPGRLVSSYVPTFSSGPSPQRLVYNQVLSGMAELAYHRQGALGYMSAYSPHALRDLIKSGGSWSSQMASGWDSSGYLLLVGENNIIPAWSRYLGTQYTTRGNYNFTAQTTDYPYASTSGSELRPELSIGRIIGNSPEMLRIPLVTSIQLWTGAAGYHYDGMQMLGVSGFPACLSGGCDNINFKAELDNTLKYMSGSVIGMVNPGYTVYNPDGSINKTATISAIQAAYTQNIRYKDVIFLAGHGNSGSWDVIAGADISTIFNPFITSNPLVFASACQTGQYKSGFSNAEAYLKSKASAYFGATEVGACPGDGFCPNADKFFSNYSSSTPFGLIVKKTKNSLGDNFFDNWWNAIYHLYGDPKISAITASSAQTAGNPTSEALPQVSPEGLVTIQVPRYEIADAREGHQVTIPGGLQPVIPGRPLTPAYQVTYDFPASTQIQDVILVGQGEGEIIPGLNLPPVTVAFNGMEIVAPQGETPAPEWWPESLYKWSADSGSLTTTLTIQVNPFLYNSLILQGLFIDQFTLQIVSLDSPLAITQLTTDRPVYDLSEQVLIDLEINNRAAEPRNGTVVATIRGAGTRIVKYGLLLETLNELQGPARYTAAWHSGGAPAGEYLAVVELRDPWGNLLGSREASFTLGEMRGEVVELVAAPEQLIPGEGALLRLAFQNQGDLPIQGDLVLEVLDPFGFSAGSFSRTMSGLAPGETGTLEAAWDTSGLHPGAYLVIGYAQYGGLASEPAVRLVDLLHRIFLPQVAR
jgi:hypothetical protein